MFIENEKVSSIDNEGELPIDFRRYLTLILHWAWLIVLASIVGSVIAYYVTSRITPVYQASTTLFINEAPSNKTNDYNSLLTSERLARTYTQIISKRPVLAKVIEQLGLDMSENRLSGMITVSLVKDTQLIEIKVQDVDPERAALIANKLVEVFSQQLQDTQALRYAASKASLQKQISDLETLMVTTQNDIKSSKDADETTRLEARLGQYQQTYNNLIMSFEQVRIAEAQTLSGVAQVEPAVAPVFPIGPNKIRNTLLAGMVVFLSCVGLIFLVDALDDTIKDPDEISKRFRMPLMGVIALMDPGDSKNGLITLGMPRAPVSEAFRALRTNIQYAGVAKPIRTLLITSTAPSEGKTTVISNLAIVMAQGGRHVTLVDADLHRPRVHRVFDAENDKGLSDFFVQSQLQVSDWTQETPQQGLSLICSGPLPPNPSELLGSQKMKDIFGALLETSDMVFLDAPPILSVTDATVLAPIVDAVLIVVRPGETHSSALRQTVDQLRQVNANLIGFVVNGIGVNKGSSYNYYYRNYYKRYYNYYSSDGKSGLKKRSNKWKWFGNRKSDEAASKGTN
jgi:non-specific protein-tyrosine kinase